MTAPGFWTMPWRNPRTTATSGVLPAGPKHLHRARHPPCPCVLPLGLADPDRVLHAVCVRELLEGRLRVSIAVERPGQVGRHVDLPGSIVRLDRDRDAVAGLDARAALYVLPQHHVGNAAVDRHPRPVGVAVDGGVDRRLLAPPEAFDD